MFLVTILKDSKIQNYFSAVLLAMIHEVVICEIEPRVSKFECQDGKWSAICNNYDFEEYQINQPITRSPKYLALRSTTMSKYIKRVVKINPFKSDFAKGLIVPLHVQKCKGDVPNVLIKLNAKEEDVACRTQLVHAKNRCLRSPNTELSID